MGEPSEPAPATERTISPSFSLAHYGAILSTVAFLVSGGSLYLAKLSYDLTVSKDSREQEEKLPTVDIQLTPTGRAKSANVTLYVFNHSDFNIIPEDITAFALLEQGELYLSSANQSVEKLSSSLSARSMGVIPPKGNGTMKATVSGVTDGKDDWPTRGADITFVVRIRVGDEHETLNRIILTRQIKPAT